MPLQYGYVNISISHRTTKTHWLCKIVVQHLPHVGSNFSHCTVLADISHGREKQGRSETNVFLEVNFKDFNAAWPKHIYHSTLVCRWWLRGRRLTAFSTIYSKSHWYSEIGLESFCPKCDLPCFSCPWEICTPCETNVAGCSIQMLQDVIPA